MVSAEPWHLTRQRGIRRSTSGLKKLRAVDQDRPREAFGTIVLQQLVVSRRWEQLLVPVDLLHTGKEVVWLARTVPAIRHQPNDSLILIEPSLHLDDRGRDAKRQQGAEWSAP